ncbi:MAG: divalent-cation tolerance protein CutA [Proteobacteria bacterium]|nr:divalent-cation tolerance protein CutA [Pseudomonadota bacterium]MDA1059685.1 divalent-cation tolerance protein CutA [Pseudomonadota bacterium]
MTDAARFVYVTATDRVEAVAIGRALVSERLAACANVIDPVASIYWWEGAVHEGAEAVLVLKSRADLIAPLTERIKALHSYDCPCVVALPIDAGNPAYLDWIVAETSSR